jgi:hypothetical protein
MESGDASKTPDPTPLNPDYIISVEIDPSDTTLQTVKDVCARISRRRNWWGFSLRGCVPGNGEISCECSPVTETPRITSYFAFGSDSKCTTTTAGVGPGVGSTAGGLGGTFVNGARSVYALASTTTILGTRQRSVWTSSSLGYATPTITAVSGANNSPTIGGNRVTLRGTNMGPANAGFVAHVRYGNPDPNTIPRELPYDAVNCRVPLDNDQTSIVCTMAPGVGSGHHWRVTMGGDSGAGRRRRSLQTSAGVTSTVFAANTRYRPPVIESFSNPYSLLDANSVGGEDPTKLYLTQGDEYVEILGTNLGPPSNETTYLFNVRAISRWPSNIIKNENLTKFVATGCKHEIPHRAIRCIVPEGAGSNIAWKLFVDEQESVQPTTAYGPPEILQIKPSLSDRGTGARSLGNSTVDVVTGGGDVIHIIGRNFGANIAYLESLTYGCSGSGNQWSFEITKSCTLVKAHTEFVCTTAPGVGNDLVFKIVIAGQTSLTPTDDRLVPTLSYKEPLIYSLERNTERSNPALLRGGVTFGGFGYRLGTSPFSIGLHVLLSSSFFFSFSFSFIF